MSLIQAPGENSKSSLPSVDEVIATMVHRDTQRRLALGGYTGLRRYVLENTKRQKHAEMLVFMSCQKDGSKQFDIVSSSGWGGASKHVFNKLLQAETEASQPGSSEDSRVTPDNYSFRMLREEQIDGRKAFVIELKPKREKKYLMAGTIWIDVEDYAIIRMQGKPAQNPSFWIKSVQLDRSYEKHGLFWLPVSNTSVSDVRIFGPTELKIEYVDYTLNEPTTAAAGQTPAEVRLR